MPATRRPLISALLLAASIGVAFASAAAQQPGAEIIRGRVVDDSGKSVVGAAVIVTRGPDRLTLQTTSDSSGAFSIRFDEGTGDYLVHVAFPGLRSARRRVQREGSERDLVANFSLATDVAVLEATRTMAARPVRATNPITPTMLEAGSAERWQDGVRGQVAPTIAGDLNAVAGTMSNITMGALGPSILGSDASSNLNTLNGSGLAAGSIPRAARTETRVTAATFDVTRGGFAGANVDVRLGPGSRTFQQRNGFVALDPPGLQFGDATTRALGTTSGGVRASLGADGELIRRALTYNVALDVARAASDPMTLLDATTDALLRAGVAPDSVARLIAIASPLGIPLTAPGVPGERRRDGITWLGRLDDTRDTLQTRALTTYAGYTTDGALGFSPIAAPSASGERSERTLGAQLTLGAYVGPGRRILTETRAAASGVRSRVDPYQRMPGVSVLVRSAGVDGADGITGLTLGGAPGLASAEDRWTAEAANETIWNARGRVHRFKGFVWGRADGLRQEPGADLLGTFQFASLADLAANRPRSFSRILSQPVREASSWNVAGALAHQWIPSRFFSILYGARVEASGFASAPARNVALEQALGVTTGVAPTRLHVSPRVGFTFTYNRDRDNGSGTNQTDVGRFYRTPVGTLRGGIGEFRDLQRPTHMAEATAATGLPGSTSRLSCVGDAVPLPDWDRFAADPTAVPTACLGGGGVLAERAPSVFLLDPGYDVPRSWRASLDWLTSIRRWTVRVGVLGSYDLAQPGSIDANFAGQSQFTLVDEGGRPMFVPPAAIDPGSGAVSAALSRRTDAFGRVNVRTSDLRGHGAQATISVSPDVFRFRGPNSLFASLGYTIQATRREFRGFDGAAFGDPREREWAPGANDARHVVVLSGGVSTRYLGTITLFGRAQSGLPFTALVQGDPNGDGRSGDRAFVPDPGTASDPVLAGQLRTLLSSGSPAARECLADQLGRMAVRNGCRGPWSQSLNLQWRPRLPSRFGRRITPNIYLQNVLAGLDQVLHGPDGARGWGAGAMPDPFLLVPRGFDPASRRFRYDVNPRFADTRPGRSIVRDPFRIVLDFSMNLSTDFDLQRLRRAVEPVRAPQGGWRRRTADSLAAFYLSNTSSIHKFLLAESDSLFLSAAQIAALRQADSVYSAEVREIYRPLAELLALGEGSAGKAELDSVRAVQKSYWKVFWRQPEIADSILTPVQRELMPLFRNLLATPMAARENSQWQFGFPVSVLHSNTMPVRRE